MAVTVVAERDALALLPDVAEVPVILIGLQEDHPNRIAGGHRADEVVRPVGVSLIERHLLGALVLDLVLLVEVSAEVEIGPLTLHPETDTELLDVEQMRDDPVRVHVVERVELDLDAIVRLFDPHDRGIFELDRELGETSLRALAQLGLPEVEPPHDVGPELQDLNELAAHAGITDGDLDAVLSPLPVEGSRVRAVKLDVQVDSGNVAAGHG